MNRRHMLYLSRHWRRIGLSLVPFILVFLHSLGIVTIGVLDRVDAMIFDSRLRATMPQTFDDRIVIVDIDEKSLAELGRWPWSRRKMADLTQSLFEKYEVALAGFDVVFAEPDDSSGLKQLQALAQQQLRHDAEFVTHLAQLVPSLDYDGAFAKALAGRPVVLGYYFTGDQGGRTNGVLPEPVMSAHEFHNHRISMTEWSGFGSNINAIAQAAPLAGFFNSLTEPDGIVRSLPLVVRYSGNYYESLSLAMFRRLTGMPQVTPGFVPGSSEAGGRAGLQSVVLKWPDKTFSIPVDSRGAVLVPFRGPGGTRGGSFNYVSANDVLAGRVPESQLRGKIVLIGTTAPGIVDLRATPVDAVYPGIEVQANALASLLDRHFLVRPVNAEGYETLLVLLIGVTLAFSLPLLKAHVAILSSVAVVVVLLAMNWWLYLAHGVVLNLAPVLMMAVTISMVNVGYGYLVTSRSRRELIALFGTYVPPELVQEMIKDPDNYSMQAKSDELTVMFCDMRGFTGMSEQLDPLELQILLNQVFSELTRLIGANRGTVDKYMGDCVMAFWGAPVESPTHAKLAVKTALEMTQALGRINQAHKANAPAHANLNIALGIGLNTGQMYVGDMGSNIRRSYTVIGDAVNLGSRLEGLSKIYGVGIVASEYTKVLATDYVWQELDRVRVKGKQQAIAIFTPVAPMGSLSVAQTEELALWHDFLIAYRSQDRSTSDVLMAKLLQLDRTKPLYTLYARRITVTRDQPIDPDWDGATNFESK